MGAEARRGKLREFEYDLPESTIVVQNGRDHTMPLPPQRGSPNRRAVLQVLSARHLDALRVHPAHLGR
jgi:endonuclease/exonuclease/phosphatase family metal-dependent hydrolase